MNTNRKTRKIKKVVIACMTGMVLLIRITAHAAQNEASEHMQKAQMQEITTESSENTKKQTMENIKKAGTTENNTKTTEEQIPPKELDLGDYQTEMNIGDKQLLTVTILPMNTTTTELSYNSSNTKVATINGMGRITALKKGKTQITVTCGSITESFELMVKEVQSTEIEVTELDLGDCPKEIVVGTSQILSVAVIPVDATNTTFEYESNNPEVASVNALGRLTANAIGTAKITVSCGKVKQTFQIKVVEDETEVEVTDIEMSDYEEELNVDSTLSLSVTVLPKDATDTDITYQSSNPQIATVNSSGEVKGIAPGEVTISISAGKITKQAKIKVKKATKAISLNKDYQVMKPNDTFQIKAQVQPADAPGKITYKSLNTEVAEVSFTGKITAKACGNTSIVVSNGDLQVSVNIIVNEESISVNAVKGNEQINTEQRTTFPDIVNVKEYPVISTQMLKYFYEKEKVLTIQGEDYTIFLDGKDIVNFENELKTELIFKSEEHGFTLMINDGRKLCGKITIDISEKITDEKFLYLYNKEKGKYQSLKTEDISLLSINTEGKYLITSKQVSGLRINVVLIVIGCVAVLLGIGGYIGVKKQYWFW